MPPSAAHAAFAQWSAGMGMSPIPALAPVPVAIGLPHSPAAAVLLLLVILAVTYALLTLFIKVSVPTSGRSATEYEAEEEYDDTPDPDWPSETVPREVTTGTGAAGDESAEPSQDAEYVREPLSIEAVSVRGTRITLGDTASQVMAAFRPGEGETVPLVERNTAGQARYVARTYRLGRRTLTLVMERETPDDPLRLARIEIGQ